MKILRLKKLKEFVKKKFGKDWQDNRMSKYDKAVDLGYQLGMQGYINVED